MTTNTELPIPTAAEIEEARLKACRTADPLDRQYHERLILRRAARSDRMRFQVGETTEADVVANRAKFDALLAGRGLDDAAALAEVLRAVEAWTTNRTEVANNPAYVLAGIPNEVLVDIHGMAAVAAVGAPASVVIGHTLRYLSDELVGRLAGLDDSNPF